MDKVLILASVASMIDQFNIPYITLLQEMGFEVDVACNFVDGNSCSAERVLFLKHTLEEKGVRWFQVEFARNIFNISSNLKAYKRVNQLLRENKYKFIHCHSPIGGVVGRLAGHRAKIKVIYTVHGFHFYKGAPLKNWILFYPVEKLLSRYTDVLVTINKEDYAFASKKMKAKSLFYLPGIGINLDKYRKGLYDKYVIRKQLGIPDNAILLFSVGELNDNKNHELVIRAIKDMDVYYMIAGQGQKEEFLKDLIKKNDMEERVRLLGFRTNVSELYSAADIFVFPSFREGLSVSLMESMASGLPCAVSYIRGNVDLISEDGGALFSPDSVEECKKAIKAVLMSDMNKMGMHNMEKVEEFGQYVVLNEMKKIYQKMD